MHGLGAGGQDFQQSIKENVCVSSFYTCSNLSLSLSRSLSLSLILTLSLLIMLFKWKLLIDQNKDIPVPSSQSLETLQPQASWVAWRGGEPLARVVRF